MSVAVLEVQSILDQKMKQSSSNKNSLLLEGDLLKRIDKIFTRAFLDKAQIFSGMIAYLQNRYGFTYTVFKYNEINKLVSIRLKSF